MTTDMEDMEDITEWGSRCDGPMTSEEYSHMYDLSPPGLCPFCRSNGPASIDGEAIDEKGSENHKCVCSSCKKKWLDKYDEMGLCGYEEITEDAQSELS